jgi:type I restriction enzyme R subunit
MHDYSHRDQKNYGDMDIAKTALPRFQEKLQVCRELLHTFNYSKFMSDTATDKDRADIIKEGVNSVLGKDEDDQKLYRKEALLLKQARSLCQSLLQRDERFESTYFEALRIAINKFVSPRKLSFKEINAQIGELLKQSVKSEGVINLFEGSEDGTSEQEFSLFSPRYLEEISKMKEKNLAAELLKKLKAEQVHIYQRTDFTQAKKFSERMQMLKLLCASAHKSKISCQLADRREA